MRKSLERLDGTNYKITNLQELARFRKNSVKSYKPAGAALCAAVIMMQQPPVDSVSTYRVKNKVDYVLVEPSSAGCSVRAALQHSLFNLEVAGITERFRDIHDQEIRELDLFQIQNDAVVLSFHFEESFQLCYLFRSDSTTQGKGHGLPFRRLSWLYALLYCNANAKGKPLKMLVGTNYKIASLQELAIVHEKESGFLARGNCSC